jgi:hypothetical protein
MLPRQQQNPFRRSLATQAALRSRTVRWRVPAKPPDPATASAELIAEVAKPAMMLPLLCFVTVKACSLDRPAAAGGF